MVNWTEIHEDFEYYQQSWERAELTYQDAQEWVQAGFAPHSYSSVRIWKNLNFTPQEVKSWRDVSLKLDDYKFASYLKQNNLTPEQYKNKSSQALLNHLYSNKNQVKKINLYYLKSYQPSELIIADYPELERIDGYKVSNLAKITINNCSQLEQIYISRFENDQQLILSNLPNLRRLVCYSNNLTALDLTNCENLETLYLSNNNLHQDLSFLKDLVGLRELRLENNPFYGSLEPLKEMNKVQKLNISNTDLDSGLEYLPESVEYFACSAYRKDAKCQTIYNLFANEQGEVETDEHKRIKNFPQKLKKHKEISQWANGEAALDDYKFVAWIRDTKKLGSEWVTNYQEDYQTLRKRFKNYGLCPECNRPNTGEKWCETCNSRRLEKNFDKWTSNNLVINEFIQKYQLKATDADKFIEWIPYEQFKDIEYLAEGGFGKVYKAKWLAGNIHHWDTEKKQWYREKDKVESSSILNFYKKYRNYREVVLKSLNNSQGTTSFIQEIKKHKIIDDWFNNIVPCYGLTQDFQTGDYLMVMKYMPGGNLRHYLSNKNRELTLQDKFSQLLHLAQGLKDIHQKNLVHRDFHPGNILKGVEKTACSITDLGLCRPVNETNEEKIFGVMPYIAPEVLHGQSCSQANDIYSLGIVAYEILSGLPPYYDRAHNPDLALSIWRGLRPQFQIKIPQLLEDLIKRCWDADPNQRPTAQELERTLRSWEQGDSEFTKQLQEAEEHNKTLPEEIKFPKYQIHQGASYHSKLLPTKEITRLSINNQLQTKTIELNTYLMKTQQLAKELIDLENLAKTKQKKYDDFKRALEIVLEKSEELETIINDNQLLISEEMKTKLIEIKQWKTKVNELQKEDNNYQELKNKKSQKEKELEELKNNYLEKTGNYGKEKLQEKLTELLELQIDITVVNASSAVKGKEKVIKRLIRKTLLSADDLNNLCQKQTEIIHLESQLNQLQETNAQKTKHLTQIVREKNTQIVELEEKLVEKEQQAQIQQTYPFKQ